MFENLETFDIFSKCNNAPFCPFSAADCGQEEDPSGRQTVSQSFGRWAGSTLKFKSIDFGPNGNGLLMSFVSSFYAAQNDLFVAISPLSDLSPFWGRQYFYIDANWMMGPGPRVGFCICVRFCGRLIY